MYRKTHFFKYTNIKYCFILTFVIFSMFSSYPIVVLDFLMLSIKLRNVSSKIVYIILVKLLVRLVHKNINKSLITEE